jgi:hypothetical protein
MCDTRYHHSAAILISPRARAFDDSSDINALARVIGLVK